MCHITSHRIDLFAFYSIYFCCFFLKQKNCFYFCSVTRWLRQRDDMHRSGHGQLQILCTIKPSSIVIHCNSDENYSLSHSLFIYWNFLDIYCRITSLYNRWFGMQKIFLSSIEPIKIFKFKVASNVLLFLLNLLNERFFFRCFTQCRWSCSTNDSRHYWYY